MEVLRTCKLCKANKTLNNFEPYGRNFRQQCRQCRTSVIGGQTMQLQVVTALQEQTASVARAEQKVAAMSSNIEETRDIISTLSERYEEQIKSLSETKDQLLQAIKEVESKSVEQAIKVEESLGRLVDIANRVEEVMVSSKDFAVKQDLHSIHEKIREITENVRVVGADVVAVYNHAKYIPKPSSPPRVSTPPSTLQR